MDYLQKYNKYVNKINIMGGSSSAKNTFLLNHSELDTTKCYELLKNPEDDKPINAGFFIKVETWDEQHTGWGATYYFQHTNVSSRNNMWVREIDCKFNVVQTHVVKSTPEQQAQLAEAEKAKLAALKEKRHKKEEMNAQNYYNFKDSKLVFNTEHCYELLTEPNTTKVLGHFIEQISNRDGSYTLKFEGQESLHLSSKNRSTTWFKVVDCPEEEAGHLLGF